MIDVKPFVETLNKRPVAVFGLGISNMAAINALVKAGAKVVAWDDDEDRRDDAKKAGAKIADLTDEDLTSYGCLVLAPGVPYTFPEPHDVVKKAQEAGIEIICDIEILHRCNHGRKVIGITGTNGKSTTTALVAHILTECGVKTALGGNIGKAVLDLTMPPKQGVFVLELSSFQMDLCPTFSPDIPVLLNLAQDHIDRHGSMDAYADAKKKVFRGTGSEGVIGTDDPWSKQLYEDMIKDEAQIIHPISVSGSVENGVYVEAAHLFDALKKDEEPHDIFELKISTLPGVHNYQNAAASFAVARLMGLAPERIYEAMQSFPGLPHRQQLVRVINGVAYVNDSKATNASATARGLACYRNIYWIAGGRPKEGGLNGLEQFVDNIHQAFLIGEAVEEFAAWLDNHGVSHNYSKTLDVAVNEAHRLAQSERGQPGGTGTVLLSPACASYDQFKSFEERGYAFIDLVDGLQEDI